MFALSKLVDGVKVLPGIKELPEHLRHDFRNEFIRPVFKYIANSEFPWTNPDVESLQAMYQVIYPMYPAKIRHNDAVFHPVSLFPTRCSSKRNANINRKTLTSVGVLRNHLAVAAIAAVQEHAPNVFRQKRLKTVEARAAYIEKLFESEDDHPIIWREYIVGDIKNHAEVGGYKTVRTLFI